jgi:hypothetical protein
MNESSMLAMNPKKLCLLLGAMALLPLNLPAEEIKTEPPAASPISPAPAPAVKPAVGKPVYKPPMVGAPSVRVGGGSRGGGTDAALVALVPDHAGLTTKAQPSLFWYQSKPAKARLEITFAEPKKIKPIARMQSNAASKTGIQRINLSKFKVELQPNVSYKWSIALVTDEGKRSQDVVATGVINRVPESDELATKLKAATPEQRPFVYATAGMWYDALESISDLIDANPGEPKFRAQRADLLRQVGLAATVDQEKEKPKASN